MKISNLPELRTGIDHLPEIARKQIQIVFENDRMDGPSEGVCSWQNKRYYFIWCGEMDRVKDIPIRKFLIIDLTEDQINKENEIHQEFLRLSKKGNLRKFYNDKSNYPATRISQSQLVGWFAD